MGIGFVVIVAESEVKSTLNWFEQQDIEASEIGKVISGEGTLTFS